MYITILTVYVCVPDQVCHTEANEVCPAQAWYTCTHTIQRGQTGLGTTQLLISSLFMEKSEWVVVWRCGCGVVWCGEVGGEGGGGPAGLHCLTFSVMMVCGGNYQSHYYWVLIYCLPGSYVLNKQSRVNKE